MWNRLALLTAEEIPDAAAVESAVEAGTEVPLPAALYLIFTLLLFVLLYIKGKKKYVVYCEPLDQKEFPLKSLMMVGHQFMEMIHYSYATALDRKVRRQLRELRDAEYVEFYLRSYWAAGGTYFMIGVLFSGLLAVANVEIWLVFAVLGFGALLGYSAFSDLDKKIADRHMAITMDLPDFANKLLILSGAGLAIKAAMIKISKEMDKDTPFYAELKRAVFMMENGSTTEQAMDFLCDRCNTAEVRRLTSVLLQNMHSGGVEVLRALKEISNELWTNRRAMAKQIAEAAGTKLLFPMMLTLLAVILIVAAPAVMSLNMT